MSYFRTLFQALKGVELVPLASAMEDLDGRIAAEYKLWLTETAAESLTFGDSLRRRRETLDAEARKEIESRTA